VERRIFANCLLVLHFLTVRDVAQPNFGPLKNWLKMWEQRLDFWPGFKRTLAGRSIRFFYCWS
jgi:hypothetical protein